MMKLCFSTECVDLDNQAPNRNKRESKYFWDELLRLIAAGGFKSIEIPYEPKWDFGGRSGIPRTMRSLNIKFGSVQGYVNFLRENGIESIDCIHLNPTLFCQGALPMFLGAFKHYAEEAMEMASLSGCPAVTLTATPTRYALSGVRGDLDDAGVLSQIAGVISELSETAKSKGITLCVKNEFWGLAAGEKITAFLKQLPDDVKLDLDTAHLYIAGADIGQVIADNRERIGVVHLTDTAFIDDQGAAKQVMPEYPRKAATRVYRDPGYGTVDFESVLRALKEAGYDGTLVLNPKNTYDISRSILLSRWFADQTLKL